MHVFSFNPPPPFHVEACMVAAVNTLNFRAQLFEGRLALNLGLNLTRVSLSCVQKHFLG